MNLRSVTSYSANRPAMASPSGVYQHHLGPGVFERPTVTLTDGGKNPGVNSIPSVFQHYERHPRSFQILDPFDLNR